MIRDFMSREIEKMEAVINAIRLKFFGGKESMSITLETQIKNAKGMLLN